PHRAPRRHRRGRPGAPLGGPDARRRGAPQRAGPHPVGRSRPAARPLPPPAAARVAGRPTRLQGHLGRHRHAGGEHRLHAWPLPRQAPRHHRRPGGIVGSIMSTEPTHSPDEPLDAVDLALLADLARIVEEIDPVPDVLVVRSLFAITLAGLEAEVMELEYVQVPEMSVRGDAPPVEARTITFTSESVTVMISLSATDDGRVRIDGWAAPATALRVELHRPGTVSETASDEDGRFVFDAVDRGPAILVVRRADGAGGAVSTPVVEL